MQTPTGAFDNPFFTILGGIGTLFSLAALVTTIYLWAKGALPVLWRLGMGLSTRKIAIFAEDEFEGLKNMLADSKIFQVSNINRVDKKSIKKAAEYTLLLVDWKSFGSEIDEILQIKRDPAALIVYAPPRSMSDDDIRKIDAQRNSIIVNLRGRLVNDILTSMMTTSFKAGYEQK
jgi:muconolactone delta-isomerase